LNDRKAQKNISVLCIFLKMNQAFRIFGVCFGLVLLPFIQGTGLFAHSSSVVCGLLLMSSVMFLFAYLSSSGQWSVNIADIVVLLFLTICSVGLSDTYDPLLILQNIGLFSIYIGFRSLKTNDGLFFILPAVVAACFLQSVYGILQYHEWMTPNHPMQFLTGSFPNQNLFSAYICLGAIICFGMFLFAETVSADRRVLVCKIITGCLVVWFTYIIILTGTRAVWAGTAVAVIFSVYVRCSDRIGKWQKKTKMIIAGVMLVVFCIGIFPLHFNFKKDSSDGRLFIWKVTLQMITRNPITGNAAGSFRADYPYAQAAYLAVHPSSSGNRLADNITNPFNEYLNLAYKHGLPGLIIMTIFAVFVLRMKNSPFSGILKSCLVALSVIAFFSYPFQLFTFKLTGIMIAALLCNLSFYKPVFTVKTRTVAPCICVLFFFTALYGHHVRTCKKSMEAYDTDTAYKSSVFRNSYNLLKNNHEYLHLYVRLLLRLGDQSAAEQLKRLSETAPDTQVMCDMGDMYQREGKYELAEKHYLLAHHMVPAKFIPLHKLLTLYVETGQREKTRKTAKKISEKPVKVKTNVTDRIKREAEKILTSVSEKQ
jgi:tetratricopeptide (TPR) repeat protein